MIGHVVTWKLKDEEKVENALKIKSSLETLTEKIQQIKFLEVGINKSGGEYDVILITKFDSFDALAEYDIHPEHQNVKKIIKPLVTDRIVVDYEVE